MVINFEEDVIGIVGFNGFGKFNIVDVICWVFGEQKSWEFCLDFMLSVIFNGIKWCKVGGVVLVFLIFENIKNFLFIEYYMFIIMCMFYCSGDSEYWFNGVICCFKDIIFFFLDMGIGFNFYVIIVLGMVDDILADKDNFWCKMFEQAVGIFKYKVCKCEIFNKLKYILEDFDWVEDLFFEINNNLKLLEKQAKCVCKYFELKEKYKSYSIELAIFKIGSFKQQQEGLCRKLIQEEDNYWQYDVEINIWEVVLEQECKVNLDKE